MMAGDTVWKWPNKSILGEGGGGKSINFEKKNTIKAGGSTARAQNVDWMDGVEWMGDNP